MADMTIEELRKEYARKMADMTDTQPLTPDRQRWAKLLPIIQAYVSGARIEFCFLPDRTDAWVMLAEGDDPEDAVSFNYSPDCYRIMDPQP